MQDLFLVCCFAFVKLLLNYSHLLEFSFCVKILMFQQVLKFKIFFYLFTVCLIVFSIFQAFVFYKGRLKSIIFDTIPHKYQM